MKNLCKRFSSLLLSLALVLTSIIFLPQTGNVAEAAGKYYIPRAYQNMTFYYAPDDLPATYATLMVYQKNTKKKPKASSIKSLKSSDPSIARPYIDKNGNIRVYFFKKTGKAVISFKIGSQKLSSTINIKKYTNPLKTFKVGKKNFLSHFNNSTEYNYFHTSPWKNQKVSIKAASGWRISSLSMQYGTGTCKINANKKKISFSKKVTFDGKTDYITVTMYHVKTKSYVTLNWNCMQE
ncbi:MAG: hypothetical protein HFH41_05660 [Lachnospiraceae bacterium]|nr:hypothetical protein [Lachnospiraceae bacterium]